MAAGEQTMTKLGFWLLWAVDFIVLLACATGAGCFVVFNGKPSALLIPMLGLIGLIVFCLFKAAAGFSKGAPIRQLALFLALPPVFAFALFGSCVLVAQ